MSKQPATHSGFALVVLCAIVVVIGVVLHTVVTRVSDQLDARFTQYEQDYAVGYDRAALEAAVAKNQSADVLRELTQLPGEEVGWNMGYYMTAGSQPRVTATSYQPNGPPFPPRGAQLTPAWQQPTQQPPPPRPQRNVSLPLLVYNSPEEIYESLQRSNARFNRVVRAYGNQF